MPCGNKVFAYNGAHRMVQFTKNGTLLTQYNYNAMGQRVKKTYAGDTYYYFYSTDGMPLGNYKLKTNGSADYVDYIWLDGSPISAADSRLLGIGLFKS